MQHAHQDEEGTGHEGGDHQAAHSILLDDAVNDDDEGAGGATDLDFAAAEEGDQEAGHDGGENACFRGGSRCNAEGNGQRQGYDTNNYPGQEVLDQGLFGITIFQSCKQLGFEITFDFHKIYTLFFAAQR